jgi:deoxycytidine triphosphate deaminase
MKSNSDFMILSGTSGSGKTTVADRLCQDHGFEVVQSVTTRDKRKDDKTGRYEYISDEEFNELLDEDELKVHAEYRDEKYGIKRSEFRETRRSDKTAILVITPESAVRHFVDKETGQNEFISIFIDAPDEELEKRLNKRRSEGSTKEGGRAREQDREYKQRFWYALENYSVKKTVSAINLVWQRRFESGVLGQSYIKALTECDELILNSDEECISNASYDLRLGDEYYNDGEIKQLTTHDPFIRIEPYDYAIVTSREAVSFPGDVVGRFDLSVSMFCQGVILSNGPQIDPGFNGKLFCLLFNTSSSEVKIKRGQTYATLEMKKTLSRTTTYTGKYQGKEHIKDYLPDNTPIMSGGVYELKKQVESLREDVEEMESNIKSRTITLTLGISSIIVALIALVFSIVVSLSQYLGSGS